MTVKPDLSRVQRIDVNLKAGRSALDKQDFANALARFRQVDRDQKGYQDIDALIADTVVRQRAAFDKAIDDGQKNEEANRLFVARQWYQRAAYFDPNAAIAREKDVLLMNKMLPEVDPALQPGVFRSQDRGNRAGQTNLPAGPGHDVARGRHQGADHERVGEIEMMIHLPGAGGVSSAA